jgi:Zn-dependent protease with chaperone function
MTTIPGRFHDGVTATAHVVAVKVAEDGLEIVGAAARAFWRRQDVEIVDKTGRVWRLTSKDAPDARLIVDKTPENERALRAVGIVDPGRDARRALGLVGGLVAVSAALAFIVFVAIPMGAEPMARATPRDVEAQLGENLARQANVFLRPCKNTKAADAAIAPMVDTLAVAGDPGFPIRLTFVREESPNALALAGGQIMVTSGLLEIVESPDELAAVIAHEIGHVKSRDGMVALYRNAGLGILLELITGGSGLAQQAIMVGGQLTELSYTRGQEARADRTALAMLDKAGLDPASLARAFERLKSHVEADEKPRDGALIPREANIPEWLKSHPDLDRRIALARKQRKTATAVAMTPEAFAVVRKACAAD